MRFAWLLVLLVGSLSVAGHPIKVRIFSGESPQQVTFTVVKGSYALIALNARLQALDTVAWLASSKEPLVLMRNGERVAATWKGKAQGKFHGYMLVGSDSSSAFSIQVGKSKRTYDGDLRLRSFKGHLQPVNVVEINRYVAGVVESEGGHMPAPEFFKAQAILARTFALKNLRKHADEGYNLKDDVTSQVYFNRPSKKHAAMIWKSVLATWDTILVDHTCEPILGVFHANSGGETVDVEDVWSRPLPYLRSRPDSFSLGQRSATWEKKVSKADFIQFLATKLGASAADVSLQKAVLNFRQDQGRKNYFVWEGKRVNLKDVRSKFNLRSTYFSVKDAGDELLLVGRGYGHGVGLSQDGAIRMDELGHDFKEILQFYYRDVEFEHLRYRD
jgi:stage II sporulation protein D